MCQEKDEWLISKRAAHHANVLLHVGHIRQLQAIHFCQYQQSSEMLVRIAVLHMMTLDSFVMESAFAHCPVICIETKEKE